MFSLESTLIMAVGLHGTVARFWEIFFLTVNFAYTTKFSTY